MTEEARASALGAGVRSIVFSQQGFDKVLEMAGAPPVESSDIAFAFGGLRSRLLNVPYGPVRFNPNERYRVVSELDGTVHPLDFARGNEPPTFDPEAQPNTLLYMFSIPRRWTSEELAVMTLNKVYPHPKPAQVVARLNTVGAVAGGLAGMGIKASTLLQDAFKDVVSLIPTMQYRP